MTDDEHVCGAPTAEGGPCQITVAHPHARCHHHPRTILEEETELVGATAGDRSSDVP